MEQRISDHSAVCFHICDLKISASGDQINGSESPVMSDLKTGAVYCCEIFRNLPAEVVSVPQTGDISAITCGTPTQFSREKITRGDYVAIGRGFASVPVFEKIPIIILICKLYQDSISMIITKIKYVCN